MDLKTEKDIAWITDVLKANLSYAKKTREGKACFSEISELMNDLIDNLKDMPVDGDEFTKSARWVFLSTSLMPMSFGIYVDFLAGNTPVCFMQLRMIIESMVLYYEADQEHRDQSFFYDKLMVSEKIRSMGNVKLSKVISAIDPDAAKLWHKCSQWMHAPSLAGKLVKNVAEHGVPTWGLAIPMEYTYVDRTQLLELGKEISKLREILKRLLEKWN